MRDLTEKEAQIFFEKLAKFIGNNCEKLLEVDGEPYKFVLIKNRVFYISEKIFSMIQSFSRDCLLSAGICMGNFTHTGRFFLHFTAIPILKKYALYKVILKQSAELGFLYGQNVMKEGVERMQEGIQKNVGVLVCNKDDIPIGFGVALQDSISFKTISPTIMVIARQGDLGEYLRSESNII